MLLDNSYHDIPFPVHLSLPHEVLARRQDAAGQLLYALLLYALWASIQKMVSALISVPSVMEQVQDAY